MAILEALEAREGFTELESQLADYVLSNADDVVRMNISDLAKASYTSSATIVRLCKKVGQDGYRSFRVGLASEVERRRSQRTEIDADHPFPKGVGVKSVVSSIAQLSKEAIDVCYSALDAYDIQRVAQAIMAAGHVYLYASGDSEISCMAFANLLLKLGVHSTIANQYGESPTIAHIMRKNDVVMIVSYRGWELERMGNVLPIIRERKAKTVLVSTLAKPLGIDLSIRIPPKETTGTTGKIATYYSQGCIRFVLNCVYGELFELTYEQSESRKLAIDRTEALDRR